MSYYGGIRLLLDLEEGRIVLPSLSIITIRLMELASEENCSVNELVSLIEKDPSLSARLIGFANSALFARRPVSTLHAAVDRVGLQRLRMLALSLSLRDTFPMGRDGAMDFENFWRSSLFRALLARKFAAHLKAADAEEAFLAALILEIGLLLLWNTPLKIEITEALAEPKPIMALLAWQRERWGMDHRDIGKIILKQWNFPPRIVSCQTLGQENPQQTGTELETSVFLASNAETLLFSPTAPFHIIYDLAQKHAGIDNDGMHAILSSVFEDVEGTAAALSLERQKKREILAILDKANIVLRQISTSLASEKPTLPSFASWPEKIVSGEPGVQFAMEAVAHEIRNPLVSVCGFAKKLAANLDISTAEGKYARFLLKEALRLEKALDHIMDQAQQGRP